VRPPVRRLTTLLESVVQWTTRAGWRDLQCVGWPPCWRRYAPACRWRRHGSGIERLATPCPSGTWSCWRPRSNWAAPTARRCGTGWRSGRPGRRLDAAICSTWSPGRTPSAELLHWTVSPDADLQWTARAARLIRYGHTQITHDGQARSILY